MYFVTVGRDGHVTAIDPVGSQGEARRTVADVDAAVAASIGAWRFRPQPVPVRSMVRFVFVIPAPR